MNARADFEQQQDEQERMERTMQALMNVAAVGLRNWVSNNSPGTGWLNRKPCISSQASKRSRRDCSSVSTPSATTLSLSECASLMMVDTSASPSGAAVISTTNERSIFSVCTGSLAR